LDTWTWWSPAVAGIEPPPRCVLEKSVDVGYIVDF